LHIIRERKLAICEWSGIRYDWKAFKRASQKQENCMPASLRFIPGTTIRWRARRFVIVDYAGLDALVAREIGKRRLYRIPLRIDITAAGWIGTPFGDAGGPREGVTYHLHPDGKPCLFCVAAARTISQRGGGAHEPNSTVTKSRP
jgi:hypothetical protein